MGATTTTGSSNSNQSVRQFSPIEMLFQKHMKRSLAQFETHYAGLKEKKDVAVARIQDDYIAKMGQAKDAGGSKATVEAKINALKAQMDDEIEQLGSTFEKSIALLLE